MSRTVLLTAHNGAAPTIEAAEAAHAATGIIVVAGRSTCNSVSGQAAVLTAVATAVRAFGSVLVIVETPGAQISSGPDRGKSLTQATVDAGAELASADSSLLAANPSWPTLVVGAPTSAPSRPGKAAPDLHAVWSGWTATVRPVDAQHVQSIDEDCVLAAIAAAALGVSEAFSWVNAYAGSDAGYRTISLNFWNPAATADRGPRLSFAPAAWWLVGLGHLGQAYGWVISWLDYQEQARVQVVLQDTDKTTPANHSTGLLTPIDSDGVPKTRLVAAALDAIGFDTRIIERRLDDRLTLLDADIHVALLGVDNLPTRRLISGVGWHLAIDAGLGSGSSDYSSILLRRFPGGRASQDVPGWREPSGRAAAVPNSAAFDDLARRGDACGLADLAGKAVGASFVGAVAACLAIAEAVKELHGGDGCDVIAANLVTVNPITATAMAPVNVVCLPLRNSP